MARRETEQQREIRERNMRGYQAIARGDHRKDANMSEVFSVHQFFEDGTSERVRDWVEPIEAAKTFRHYTNSVATKMGIVNRVIITDAGDCIAAEWTSEHGIVFPPEWVEAAIAKGVKATRGRM